MCSFTANGNYNKLGNRQFIRLPVATAGSYKITATASGGADADVRVLRRGELVSRLEVRGNESGDVNLEAEEYVLEVYDDRAVSTRNNSDACINVTVRAN